MQTSPLKYEHIGPIWNAPLNCSYPYTRHEEKWVLSLVQGILPKHLSQRIHCIASYGTGRPCLLTLFLMASLLPSNLTFKTVSLDRILALLQPSAIGGWNSSCYCDLWISSPIPPVPRMSYLKTNSTEGLSTCIQQRARESEWLICLSVSPLWPEPCLELQAPWVEPRYLSSAHWLSPPGPNPPQ